MSFVFEIYRDSYFVKFRTYIFDNFQNIIGQREEIVYSKKRNRHDIYYSFDLSICPSFLLSRCNEYNETP